MAQPRIVQMLGEVEQLADQQPALREGVRRRDRPADIGERMRQRRLIARGAGYLDRLGGQLPAPRRAHPA